MSVELLSEDQKKGPDRLIGEVLANRYQIEVRLGEGAMGSVYKAKHVKVGRAFAVKVLHKKLIEDRKVLQRFEREAELAGRLRHPNVVGVVDVGETTDGYRYMVMDFAEGLDLATLLGEAPMPAERIVHLTRQILEGLYHAHEAGLIHRDFKPENVIIERDDHNTEVPRIVDFGIAILREGGDNVSSSGRLTTNGLVLGTPHYMAPEQAVADPIDHRIDLFALGIVVYEMLCGKLPFDGTGAEVARANLLLDPPLIAQRVPYLEVDPLIEAFSRRLMAKKRELRPATAKVARELLDLIVNDRQAAATVLGVPLLSSSRQPQITQPVSPQVVDEPSDKIDLPDELKPKVEPVVEAARAEAPPMAFAQATLAPATAERSKSNQHSIRTDMSEPLTWGGKKGRRRILAGVIGLAVAAIVVVIVIRKTGGKGGDGVTPPTPTEEVPKVAMNVTASDPPAPPVDRDPVPPTDDTKGSGATEPVDVVDDPDAGKPTQPTKKPVKAPVKKPPKLIAKADPKPDPTKLDPKPDPVKPDPTKPDPTKVTPPPAGAMDATAFRSLFTAVGEDLRVVKDKRGVAAIGSFEDRYRRINYLDANSSQPKRDGAASQLKALRRELAPLK